MHVLTVHYNGTVETKYIIISARPEIPDKNGTTVDHVTTVKHLIFIHS